MLAYAHISDIVNADRRKTVADGLSLRVEQAFQRHDINVGEKLHSAKLHRLTDNAHATHGNLLNCTNLQSLKIAVFTGAGISAESGISTFRDANGLWENHRIVDVASPEGWARNMELVLEFYNQRRKNLVEAQPNAAHLAIAALEKQAEVYVITQNVDDLHERAGSGQVLHLHGELMMARSTCAPELRYRLQGWELKRGDCCEKGCQLRPDIVWFGEAVPAMEEAIPLIANCDALLVVGTSLEVYPAAGLLHFTPAHARTWLVDPNRHSRLENEGIRVIAENAGTGVPLAIAQILSFAAKHHG
jgi:NAD-dependent deacetylase